MPPDQLIQTIGGAISLAFGGFAAAYAFMQRIIADAVQKQTAELRAEVAALQKDVQKLKDGQREARAHLMNAYTKAVELKDKPLMDDIRKADLLLH